MAQDSDRRQDMMRKIRALIAKADDRAVSPEEAEAFRAKADELMTKFTVEEWELLQAGRNVQHSPVARDIDMSWWFNSETDDDTRSRLWMMFLDVYTHARVQILHRHVFYSSKTIKVVGFPNDIDYADLVFTSLHLELANAVDPQPRQDLDWYQNSVMLREAGLSWPEVHRRMKKAGLLPSFADTGNDRKDSDRLLVRTRELYQGKFTAHHKTYRRNFSTGFVSMISQRLRDLRGKSEAQTSDSGSQYALVLRDVRETVRNWMYEEFPEYKPHAADCKCAACTTKRKPIRYKRDNRRIDYAAQSAGREAGAQARIHGNNDQVGGKPVGELEW